MRRRPDSDRTGCSETGRHARRCATPTHVEINARRDAVRKQAVSRLYREKIAKRSEKRRDRVGIKADRRIERASLDVFSQDVYKESVSEKIFFDTSFHASKFLNLYKSTSLLIIMYFGIYYIYVCKFNSDLFLTSIYIDEFEIYLSQLIKINKM